MAETNQSLQSIFSKSPIRINSFTKNTQLILNKTLFMFAKWWHSLPCLKLENAHFQLTGRVQSMLAHSKSWCSPDFLCRQLRLLIINGTQFTPFIELFFFWDSNERVCLSVSTLCITFPYHYITYFPRFPKVPYNVQSSNRTKQTTNLVQAFFVKRPI